MNEIGKDYADYSSMREIWKEEIKNSEFEMEEREEENKSMKERENKSMKEREENKSMKEREEENKSMNEQEDDKSMDVEQTCSVSFTIQHSLLFKHLPPALHLRRNT